MDNKWFSLAKTLKNNIDRFYFADDKMRSSIGQSRWVFSGIPIPDPVPYVKLDILCFDVIRRLTAFRSHPEVLLASAYASAVRSCVCRTKLLPLNIRKCCHMSYKDKINTAYHICDSNTVNTIQKVEYHKVVKERYGP